MFSDGIKLFELLLQKFDKDVEVEKSFFKDNIEPLYVCMGQIYADYTDAYKELYKGVAGTEAPQSYGKLREFLLDRRLILQPFRIHTISTSERLNKARAFAKLSVTQQSAVETFTKEVLNFFNLDPAFDLLHKTETTSFYYGLIHGFCDQLLPEELRINCGGDSEFVPRNSAERLKASARYLIDEMLPERWIRLSNAYADVKMALT
jgi:hypothetical protein